MSRKTRANSIGGNWVFHKLEMRESPAWRHLPDHARRFLDALEVEHMRHGGADNGNLVQTYTQLEARGIPDKAIALAIRQAIALGFVRITGQGQRSAAHMRAPSLYELTYVKGKNKPVEDAPNLWRNITTDDAARAAVERAKTGKRYETQPRRIAPVETIASNKRPKIQKAGPL